MKKQLLGISIIDVQVGSWSPTPFARPTAVALNLKAQWNDREIIDMVLRLKSPRAVDELIAGIQKHRADVWPDAPPAAHAACDEGEPPHVAAADGIEPHIEWIDQFVRDYVAAGGRIYSRAEAVNRLLGWALEHVNLVESMREIDLEEDTP